MANNYGRNPTVANNGAYAIAGVRSKFAVLFLNNVWSRGTNWAGRTKHSYRHCLVLLDPATSYAQTLAVIIF